MDIVSRIQADRFLHELQTIPGTEGVRDFPFPRKGRTDHLILLPRTLANVLNVQKRFPEATAAREAFARRSQSGDPTQPGERSSVAWEDIGQTAVGILRISPSRSTRPAIEFRELPLATDPGKTEPFSAFAEWMQKHGIFITREGPFSRDLHHIEALLFGCFTWGYFQYRQMRPDRSRRFPVDQNQSSGFRYQLRKGPDILPAPFPLHIWIHDDDTPTAFEVQQPSLYRRKHPRRSREGDLLATDQEGSIRFLLNRSCYQKNDAASPPRLEDLADASAPDWICNSVRDGLEALRFLDQHYRLSLFPVGKE